MTAHTNPTDSKYANTDNVTKINQKIMETWSKLSDDDVKLYKGNRDQFFVKLKEKQNVSKEDGEKRLQEIERSCAASPRDEKEAATKSA